MGTDSKYCSLKKLAFRFTEEQQPGGCSWYSTGQINDTLKRLNAAYTEACSRKDLSAMAEIRSNLACVERLVSY